VCPSCSTVQRRNLDLLSPPHHSTRTLQQRCLRTILHVHWSERCANISILESAHLPLVETMIRKSQLRWAAHVVWMPDNRLPKQLLFGQLTHGVRPASGPKLRFKDIIKHSIKAFGTTANTSTLWSSIHCTDRTLRPLKVEASTTMTASHSSFIEVPSTSLQVCVCVCVRV